MARRTSRSAGREAAAELAVYRAFVQQLTSACAAAASGDLEARSRPVPGSDAVPDLVALQDSVNRVLDVSDAFVREASAALTSAAEGRYHREVLLTGLPGAFRKSAVDINAARGAMQETGQRVQDARDSRLTLADGFESVVMAMSEQVATAATQLSASAGGLTDAASAASTEVTHARETIGTLTRTSEEIKQVIALIDTVADQTRLLALNATIEAARAGEAGKGFAVVASEVKDLADQTAQATERVTAQVEAVRGACDDVSQVMGSVGTRVVDMAGLVDGIAAAVDGSASVAQGDTDVTGLSRMAEKLRSEMTGFLAQMRS
ncbi:methyl-accepting chemotaxis protein [Modestobacter sp. URMC 112]